MVETNRWIDDHWISNPMEYTFSNGTKIQFKSFDTIGKAKASGKRDVLFLNEANHIPFEIADALMIRSKETWIDYNPDAEFWAHTEILQEPNSEFLLLTYKDNEGIPPETLEDLEIKISKAFHNPKGDWSDANNIKSDYWRNWCKVYIEGEIGSLQGVVFDNWKTCANIPDGSELIAYGMDFGFSNSKTALSSIYRYNDEIYIDELIYKVGMIPSQMVTEMNRLNVFKNIPIVADSASPMIIQELSNAGFYMQKADKGPESITLGINILHEYKLNITDKSVNIIDELRHYRWDTDRSGKTLNVPIKDFDHAIDGIRYAALAFLKPYQNLGIYSFA